MCTLERHGRVYVLRLKGNTYDNRLNPSLCQEVISALNIVNESDAGALVTTNDGKFFSNGLDLNWVGQDPEVRSPIQSEWFDNLLLAFMNVKIPTIAAICGHASAGGFILAMANDHRFMRGDRGVLYMSENDVNVVLPPGPMSILRHKMNARAFKEVVLKGLKLTGPQALELELVDGVFKTASETFDAAMAEAVKLAGRNWRSDVYLGQRLAMYVDVLAKLGKKQSQIETSQSPARL